VLIAQGLTPARTATAIAAQTPVVAGLAGYGVGAEPNLDLGRHAFHARRSGSLAIVDLVNPQEDRHLVLVEQIAPTSCLNTPCS
jgi:hypothetical protein